MLVNVNFLLLTSFMIDPEGFFGLISGCPKTIFSPNMATEKFSFQFGAIVDSNPICSFIPSRHMLQCNIERESGCGCDRVTVEDRRKREKTKKCFNGIEGGTIESVFWVRVC